jgi:hypothetical protein
MPFVHGTLAPDSSSVLPSRRVKYDLRAAFSFGGEFGCSTSCLRDYKRERLTVIDRRADRLIVSSSNIAFIFEAVEPAICFEVRVLTESLCPLYSSLTSLRYD